MSRGIPTVPVICDNCGDVIHAALLKDTGAGYGYSERYVDRDLVLLYGWKVEDAGDFCPDCQKENK